MYSVHVDIGLFFKPTFEYINTWFKIIIVTV